MLHVYISEGQGLSGRKLKDLLEAEGASLARMDRAKGVVAWGWMPRTDLPSLNGGIRARGNKLAELDLLDYAGVLIPPFSTDYRALKFPILGRAAMHTGGSDIKWIPEKKGVPRADFYTQYIPRLQEYRVWVFRGEALATYLKGYKAHKEGEVPIFKATQWINDGLQENPPKGLTAPAIKAVEAVGLDFGAVDVLLGTDGKYYILEVNTAPQIDLLTRIGPKRLAKRIVKWAEGGFKDVK